MKPRKPAHAPAVDRALDIIELLAASERYLALSEIVAQIPAGLLYPALQENRLLP